MKKLITFIIVIFSVTNLYAQNKVTDSLKLLLSKEKTDTGRINLLNKIGGRFGYGYVKNDSSLLYLQQALNLSRKINYTSGELWAEDLIAYHFYYSGNYPEALKISLQSLKEQEQFKDTSLLFWQTRLILWIYRNFGDNKNGMNYAKKLSALAYSLSHKNTSTSQIPYITMANQNLGIIYANLNLIDSALHYQHLVYKNGLKSKDAQWLALSTYYLGGSYSKIGNSDSAFYFYRLSIPYTIKSGRPDYEARAKLGMATLFYKKGKLDSAFLYVRQSLAGIQNLSALDATMDAYSLFSKLYQSTHQYDSAYKYLQSFVILKDSLFNQTKIVQTINFAFNETLQQQKIEQAKKEAEQQYKAKIKLYILAAVILIFLIIAFLLLRNIRNKRNANILLSKQKEEIQSTLSELKSTQKQLIQSEKMASLGELTAGIAHEIQNPLNFVNNFSEINTEMLEELKTERLKPKEERDEQLEDAILKDINENGQKILHHGKRADAIVKGMLQHSRVSTGQKEPTDINALADEYLRLSFHGMRAKDKSFNATMKTDFDNAIGKINIIPQDIGRVLLNLFNNAFYAVAEKKKNPQPLKGSEEYEPIVTVSTSHSPFPGRGVGGEVVIKVADNGNGIPQKVVDKIFQPFFTTKPTGEGTGLGLSITYDIVKAHGGELKVVTKEGKGSEFIIQLPIKTI